MIKYLGSKRVLLPRILAIVRALGPCVRTVLDPFSGTARVGHALKAAGLRVIAGDHNRYAEVLARCLVQADADTAAEAQRILDELWRLPGRPGWFTATYCEDARYLHPKNGARIEAMRQRIAELSLPPELEAVVLTALMLAADRVDSTTGVQMAYLKEWAPRAHRDLELRLPPLLPRAPAGKGQAFLGDAEDLAGRVEADVAYLDPPYNQHSYLGNYHVWETLVCWDRPEVFGMARKRVEVKERKSAFNSRERCRAALARLVAAVQARYLVLSFNDEGFLSRADIEAMLAPRGEVVTLAFDHARYVGARIGIYNPKGEKVGTVGHLRNRELIYIAGEHLPRALTRSTATQQSG